MRKKIFDAAGIPVANGDNLMTKEQVKASLKEAGVKAFTVGAHTVCDALQEAFQAGINKGHTTIELEGALKLVAEFRGIVDRQAAKT